jgi:hypothetical protein
MEVFEIEAARNDVAEDSVVIETGNHFLNGAL